ncbi:hypothetical protein NUW58_g2793 [Xylaria curta]|uniref:Uncharacterized protein n=1 Tax=Xylaria curta TaxID=42375 RepID=A0ACC1PDU4_9PEZI|nr:hypothetical protein NUW58_g2793 [Xylaria curta]
MRQQEPAAKKSRRRNFVDKSRSVFDFQKLLRVIDEKHIPKNISIFLQQNQVETPKYPAHRVQKDHERNTTGITERPTGELRQPEPTEAEESAELARVDIENQEASVKALDLPPSKTASWQTATTNEYDGDESDAISDTSFTPPKQLGKFAVIGKDGRRRVLMPGIRGPPGLVGKARPEPKVELSFEKKPVLKKPPVLHGGIALAVMRQEALRPSEKKKEVEKGKEKKEEKPPAEAPTRRRSKKKGPKKQDVEPTEQPASSSTGSRRVGGWESAFLKGVFEIENDLLYDNRWPIATF